MERKVSPPEQNFSIIELVSTLHDTIQRRSKGFNKVIFKMKQLFQMFNIVKIVQQSAKHLNRFREDDEEHKISFFNFSKQTNIIGKCESYQFDKSNCLTHRHLHKITTYCKYFA